MTSVSPSYLYVLGQLYSDILNDKYKVLIQELGKNEWVVVRTYKKIKIKRLFGLCTTKKCFGYTYVMFNGHSGLREIHRFKIWDKYEKKYWPLIISGLEKILLTFYIPAKKLLQR
jgi:hypothetical protein